MTVYRVAIADEDGTVLDSYEVEVDEPFEGHGPAQAEAVLRLLTGGR